MALTKEKLISRLQIQAGLSKQESRAVVERVLGIVKDTLAAGEDLLVSGFGKFSVRRKNARRGRNPQTKANLILRAPARSWCSRPPEFSATALTVPAPSKPHPASLAT